MEDHKQCQKCGLLKPLSNFPRWGPNQNPYRNCKDCRNAQKREEMKDDGYRAKHLQGRHGMSLEDYQNMLDAQEGVCKICYRPSDRHLHVDHCHKTGIIRGLLCGGCNTALGLLREDTQAMQRMIVYMDNHRKVVADLPTRDFTPPPSFDARIGLVDE